MMNKRESKTRERERHIWKLAGNICNLNKVTVANVVSSAYTPPMTESR
jgi:hypothetical protein